MAITDFDSYKPIEVTSVSGAPTISRALCFKIISGDDSTTGTGEIVLDWSNISSQADIGVYDENDNLLDYYFGSFDATNETAVIWVYKDWIRDGTVQAKIAYGGGSSDQSVVASTVFDKESNLQAGYLLNESSGDALDVTSNNNDGIVTGATQGESGIVDGAYSFNGDDNIDISGVENLSFADKATLLTWVKLDIATPSDSVKTGIHQLQGSGADNTHYPYTDGLAYFSTFRSNRVSGFSLSSNVTRTNWHLVAIITENITDGWRFYQNTELVKTATGESSVSIDAIPYFGFNGDTHYLVGDQDVTFLFSEAFTETDLTAFYAATNSFPDFFSQAVAVVVVTDSSTNIDSSSATLNGTLESLEGNSSLDVYFEYGTDTSYGNTTATQTITSVPTSFSAAISNLSVLTTYHYRAVATDGLNYWYGGDVSFYTFDLRDVDETQNEFQNGTLTDVEADAGDYLRLAYANMLSFDGSNDYVEIGDFYANTHTIETWVKFDTLSQEQMLIGKEYEIYLWYSPNYSAIRYEVHIGGGWAGDARISDSNFSIGSWIHVAITYDGSYCRTYLNGSLMDKVTTSGNIDDQTTNWRLGESRSRYLAGDLVDTRIWNVARNQQQIQDNMNKRLTGGETGLVAYYKLDEGDGTTATDSAESNDGTIYGASWTTTSKFYAEKGNRVVQLDLSSIENGYEDSLIKWTVTLNGQSLTIETRYSLDGGSSWSSWQTATNGDSIPGLSGGEDFSNALLECRETLSISDISTTPQLESRSIYIAEQKSFTIALPVIRTQSKVSISGVGGLFSADYFITLPKIRSETKVSIGSNIHMGYPHIVCNVQPDRIATVMGIPAGDINAVINTN